MLLFGEQHEKVPFRGISCLLRSRRGATGQAVKSGKMLFVSGMPPFGQGGKIAVGDFPAQMKQVMDNLTGVLKSSGAGWDRVVKTTVFLTRFKDFAEMNRIYA